MTDSNDKSKSEELNAPPEKRTTKEEEYFYLFKECILYIIKKDSDKKYVIKCLSKLITFLRIEKRKTFVDLISILADHLAVTFGFILEEISKVEMRG